MEEHVADVGLRDVHLPEPRLHSRRHCHPVLLHPDLPDDDGVACQMENQPVNQLPRNQKSVSTQSAPRRICSENISQSSKHRLSVTGRRWIQWSDGGGWLELQPVPDSYLTEVFEMQCFGVLTVL